MKREEPRLCPDCPLRSWMSQVKQEPWTNELNHESDLKVCMRLRALSEPNLPECPHYPRGQEDLTLFIPTMILPCFRVNYEPKRVVQKRLI